MSINAMIPSKLATRSAPDTEEKESIRIKKKHTLKGGRHSGELQLEIRIVVSVRGTNQIRGLGICASLKQQALAHTHTPAPSFHPTPSTPEAV